MNFGMLGFVPSLLATQRDLERFFTPIMGGSILLGIAVYGLRRHAARAAAAPAD